MGGPQGDRGFGAERRQGELNQMAIKGVELKPSAAKAWDDFWAAGKTFWDSLTNTMANLSAPFIREMT
jgi:hypothetical protein